MTVNETSLLDYLNHLDHIIYTDVTVEDPYDHFIHSSAHYAGLTNVNRSDATPFTYQVRLTPLGVRWRDSQDNTRKDITE